MNTWPLPTIADLLSHPSTQSLLPATDDRRGWNSDHSIFDVLVAETQPELIVEIGTWKGRSAAHMAAASAGLTTPDQVSGASIPTKTRIFCIDTWLGGIDHLLSDKEQDDLLRDAAGSPRLYHQFLRNFQAPEWAPFADRIHPIQNTSINGIRLLAQLGIRPQLAYVDGSHEYADVYADLNAVSQLLAPGGVIFGDDFRSFPGVFAAVLRFAHESNRKVEEIDRNFWILRSL